MFSAWLDALGYVYGLSIRLTFSWNGTILFLCLVWLKCRREHTFLATRCNCPWLEQLTTAQTSFEKSKQNKLRKTLFLPEEHVFQNTSCGRQATFFCSWHSFPTDLFLLSVWVGLLLFFPKLVSQCFLPGRVSRVKVLSAHSSVELNADSCPESLDVKADF